MGRRTILHVDMDAFYAALEQLDHPELRGQPVIVGGDPQARGVVSAASYEARRFGVTSAMPAAKAQRLCPQAVFVQARFARYQAVSGQIRQICYAYTPLVEPLSLDEAFLDVTGVERSFGSAEKVAREIKGRIRREVGLSCSVGIAPNKFLAKLASDLLKPDGFVVIREGEELGFLKDLPIWRLLGVGESTARKLRELGVSTIGQLRERPLEELAREFGQLGKSLYHLSRGIDHSPVVPQREPRSISHETTFTEDLTDRQALEKILFELSQEVGRRLRTERLKGRTVQLKVRFADFSTITRAMALPRPTNLAGRIWDAAEHLFENRVPLHQGVRLLGVRVTGLIEEDQEQLQLFPDEQEERCLELERLMDELRGRFGDNALKWGRSL